MKKIGFVVPWYHKDIRGGAEQNFIELMPRLCRERQYPMMKKIYS